MAESRINLSTLRVELARRDMPRTSLAKLLDVSPSTLSSWLSGVAPTPEDLATRIEAALGLGAGSLSEEVK